MAEKFIITILKKRVCLDVEDRILWNSIRMGNGSLFGCGGVDFFFVHHFFSVFLLVKFILYIILYADFSVLFETF